MFAEKVINKMLNDKSLEGFYAYGLKLDHFLDYKEEMNYILQFEKDYGQVPSADAFVYEFNDFVLIEVEDTWEYLLDNLRKDYEYYMLRKTSEMINQSDNSEESVGLIKNFVKTIEDNSIVRMGFDDIVVGSNVRQKEFVKKNETKGLTGVTSGFKEIDELTNGWQRGEELVTILGRTNEGKSWILLKFLTEAWKAGEIPLLYSGEMSSYSVGARFDTMNEHFSNFGILNGSDLLGGKSNPRTVDEYLEYLSDLSGEQPFYVITPKNLGGKRLDVGKLESYMETLNPRPTIIGIDQYTLMSDRKSRDRAQRDERLFNITEDLYIFSEKYGVPVLGDSQAGRGASNDNGVNDTPEVHQAYGSDGIGQNSTRIISMRQTEEGLKLSMKKNRNGLVGKEFVYAWDINYGKYVKIDDSVYMEKEEPTAQPTKAPSNVADSTIKKGTAVF